jgi:hypothetical protein
VEKVDDATVLKFLQERTLSDAELKLVAAIKDRSDGELRKLGLSRIENRPERIRVIAAARLLAQRKPDGAAGVLLAYLPAADREVREVIRQSLVQVAVKDGKVEEAVRKAATDSSAPRRAVAAYVLGQAGAADRPAAMALLRDEDPEVRFAAASGLLRAGVKEGVPVLIRSLADAPLGPASEAEDLLLRLAGEDAPPVTLAGDDAGARNRVRTAWAAWWLAHSDRINPAGIRLEERGPGFVNLAAQANVQLTQSTSDTDNKNNLAQLPTGRQTFAGVKFKVGRGLIQLGSANLRGKPTEVEGIQVERPAGRLHFLHATQWGAGDGQVIARYVVHYADHTTADIDIAYATDVLDWGPVAAEATPTRGKVAWEGENDAVKAPDKIRLFLTTWDNPHPRKKILSIDYIATAPEQAAAPFCVAITAESR